MARRRSADQRGNQKRHFRKRKPARAIRSMKRPSTPLYAALNYCAVLIPERVVYSPFATGPQSPRGTPNDLRHDEMIAAIQRSGMTHRVQTAIRRRVRTTRIYVADEAGLVLLKMIDGDIIWKMFELHD